MFPLPDVTFFPHTLLPLHIFEARYRALVTDALARDRRLCIAQLQPGYEATYAGKPAVRAVAGAGQIVKWERLPTGRYNILVKAARGRPAQNGRVDGPRTPPSRMSSPPGPVAALA
jgi:Lon protease-like protein